MQNNKRDRKSPKLDEKQLKKRNKKTKNKMQHNFRDIK